MSLDCRILNALDQQFTNFNAGSEPYPVYIRHFHKHTKLAIMALMSTLYSHIFAVFFIISILLC